MMNLIQYMLLNLVMITVDLEPSLGSTDLDKKTTLFITPSSSSSVPCPANPCLTLSQFVQNSSILLSSSSQSNLIFLVGNHILDTSLTVSNISSFFMITNSSSEGAHSITCHHNVSFNFENVTALQIKGLKFIGCGGNKFLSIKNFSIESSTLQGQNNSSTALDITETNLTITNSSFVSNRVGRCLSIFDMKVGSNRYFRVGGVIFVNDSNISIIECTFLNNSAEVGGTIYSYSGHRVNYISISTSTFINNEATSSGNYIESCDGKEDFAKERSAGGALAVFNTTMIIDNSSFINNTSEAGEGGALCIEQKSVTSIFKSELYGNSAKTYGGTFFIRQSNVTINGSNFHNNHANHGGVVCLIEESIIRTINSTYEWNFAKLSGGVLSIDQESTLHDHHCKYVHNSAKLGGVLYAVRSVITLTSILFSKNQAQESGGAIYILESLQEVGFVGHCNLTYNYAGTGGAIYAVESIISLVHSDFSSWSVQLYVAFNNAIDDGGGIYLYHSTIISHPINNVVNISSNWANNKGGGIYAINSLITCIQVYKKGHIWPHQNLMIVANNSARKGGGLYLESAAQLRVQYVNDTPVISSEVNLNTTVYFTSNLAEYGSAVYVADETYIDVCDYNISNMKTTAASKAECFVQVFSQVSASTKRYNITSMEFTTVNANYENHTESTIIFGGLLDRCVPDPHRAEVLNSGYAQRDIDGITYLKLISNIADIEMVSSLPVRVCFCTPDGKPNCSYEPPTIHKMKGKSFNVSLVAVDQVNHTIANVKIYSYLDRLKSSLGEGQSTQVTKDGCTNLTFSINSPYGFEELILYPEGPCRNASQSQSRLHIVFQPCMCPIGFQKKHERNDCVCLCDSRLSPYFTDEDRVETDSESLTRHGTFWVTVIYDNNIITYSPGEYRNYSGFLIYPYCPLDYCLPATSNVYINFNKRNGADAQCANNRSGLLCSQCQPGLGLSHGSSRCIPCTLPWYQGLLLGLGISVAVGIFLVVLLMALNLTVAIGTLNGLIFYANIVSINSSIFYFSRGQSLSVKFYFIIISWLNFKIGMDICYFEQADTYWKTWLQLSFPLCLMLLIAILIIVSKHSMKFSRLIGRANPVATLATLILFSYAKFLQITIRTLSFATLHYPDGSYRRVWLPDATVEYLSGIHIALFVVAVIILIVGIAYTLVIFFWQWLLHYQDWIIFKWVTSQRLCHFIEPYHAPFVPKHRYWIGLLLFTRIALYLVFALNVSGNPKVNLVAIIITIVSLLLIKGQFGRVYKSVFVDVIETISYANLCLFSTIRLTFESDYISEISTHLSSVVVLLLLIVVFTYHVYTTFCSKCLKRCQHSIERPADEHRLPHANVNRNDSSSTESFDCKPTFSVVDLKLAGLGTQHSDRRARSQIPTGAASEMADDDNVSSISADSISPLLDSDAEP